MNKPKCAEQWLTVAQVADLLQVHVQTVRREIRSGRMRAHRISEKWWRVPERDLAAWQDATEWRPEASWRASGGTRTRVRATTDRGVGRVEP